jgi:4-hydroxy-tetrahydrodipicolinate synthase
MNKISKGVWPTMVTPFTELNEIDYTALAGMIDWYIDKGASGLFAVCQSSEMFFLSQEERVQLARETVRLAKGRIPVIASGHISDSLSEQKEELLALSDTGIDGLVLVSNRLAREQESDEIWKKNYLEVIQNLPADLNLGFYECPFPYKRILSQNLLHWLNDTGQVCFIKDTCCDPSLIKLRAAEFKKSNLRFFNANSASLLDSLEWGYSGFSGVMANFQMDLYSWLFNNRDNHTALRDEIADFLGFSSILESRGYPANAKHFLKMEGIPIKTSCRTTVKDLSQTEIMELEQFRRISKSYSSKLSMIPYS